MASGKEEDGTLASAVANLRAGSDRDASFRIVFDRFYVLVERFFAKRVPDLAERDDLIQETFVRAFKGVRRFRGDARFGTWLYRIAHNVLADWRGRRGRRAREVSLDERRPDAIETETSGEPHAPWRPSGPHSPLSRLMHEEERVALRAAIDRLPPQMGRCLKLRIYGDLSYRDIAMTLRISIQTVKAHLFQGRERLGVMAASFADLSPRVVADSIEETPRSSCPTNLRSASKR